LILGDPATGRSRRLASLTASGPPRFPDSLARSCRHRVQRVTQRSGTSATCTTRWYSSAMTDLGSPPRHPAVEQDPGEYLFELRERLLVMRYAALGDPHAPADRPSDAASTDASSPATQTDTPQPPLTWPLLDTPSNISGAGSVGRFAGNSRYGGGLR
jgi:hypothetical protein